MKRGRSSNEISDLTPPPCKKIIIKRSPEIMAQRRRETLEKAKNTLKPLFESRKDQMTFSIPPISDVSIKKRGGGSHNDNNNLTPPPRKRIIIKRSPEIMTQSKQGTLDKANDILKSLFKSRKNQATFSIPPISKKFQFYSKLAEEGNNNRQFELGECYYLGIRIPKDEVKNFSCYLEIRTSKDDEKAFSGQNNLGDSYYDGLEPQKMKKWYLKSAEGGQNTGQNNLGTSFRWNLKSAEGGYHLMKNNLDIVINIGLEPQNMTRKLFCGTQNSAEGGNSSGQNNLGYCHRYWYLKSAEGGDCGEQNSPGCCYRDGIGTTNDEEKAFYNGKNNLGYCHRDGIGTKDEEKTFQCHLTSAVERGNNE
ncbi:hypothetical protein Glove_109g423 [Diversispora epigaea]|uniref:Uncharacterized protein n=1 Tax=Diversispora epigaea TaxID=1348612 RepID=A0A397J1Z7_9GLOM|nr:hypothetical protein Glove_109g423 [Diversispora epigaea]